MYYHPRNDFRAARTALTLPLRRRRSPAARRRTGNHTPTVASTTTTEARFSNFSYSGCRAINHSRYLGLRRVVALCRLEDLQEGGVGGIAPPAAGASQEKGAGHHQPHAGNEFGEQDATLHRQPAAAYGHRNEDGAGVDGQAPRTGQLQG